MGNETTLKKLLADEPPEFAKLLSQTPDEWRREIQNEVKFDTLALDLACADQGQKFTNYAGLAAEASTLRDIKEAEWEEKKGEVDLLIRKSPRHYDIQPDDKEKIMEGAVRSAIANDAGVKFARREFLLAKQYAKIFNKSGIEGFEHRRAMILLAGKLWLKEYYHSDTDVKESDIDDFRSEMGDRQRRRKRERQTF